MPRIDDLISSALRSVGSKPLDDSPQSAKKRYSEQLSQVLAEAFAEELRRRGMAGARPGPAARDGSGAERRMSGGIGAKKVDVTWATEESGLLLAISVKTINFADARTGNFQKNVTNRRGDMLFEAVTLHRRFPYAVLVGFFVLDAAAATDETERRQSTFRNAHHRLRLFTGRDDPAGREEQYERMYVVLFDANASPQTLVAYEAGKPNNPVPMEAVFDEMVQLVADRDPDFYDVLGGTIKDSRMRG